MGRDTWRFDRDSRQLGLPCRKLLCCAGALWVASVFFVSHQGLLVVQYLLVQPVGASVPFSLERSSKGRQTIDVRVSI